MSLVMLADVAARDGDLALTKETCLEWLSASAQARLIEPKTFGSNGKADEWEEWVRAMLAWLERNGSAPPRGAGQKVAH